mmetsp:Transcript_17521/g.33249  ORF Transcript_17521/g.33249 Transcript_17521/m.33249 type:complete len:94 (+) Transcript_17521:973-1254(+)
MARGGCTTSKSNSSLSNAKRSAMTTGGVQAERVSRGAALEQQNGAAITLCAGSLAVPAAWYLAPHCHPISQEMYEKFNGYSAYPRATLHACQR